MVTAVSEQMTLPGMSEAPPAMAPLPKTLSPAMAAELYRAGLSACMIQRLWPRMTRAGVEDKIRAGGLAGTAWCSVHRVLEDLRGIK
jgi:hypothetical protein